jgi:hypothetical protein
MSTVVVRAAKSGLATGKVRRLHPEGVKIGEIIWTSSDGSTQLAFLAAHNCVAGSWDQLRTGDNVQFRPVAQTGKPQPYRALDVERMGAGGTSHVVTKTPVTWNGAAPIVQQLVRFRSSYNQSQSPVLFSAFISDFFSAHPAGKDLIRQSSSQATKFVTDSCGQFLTLTPAAHGQHYIALTSVGRQLTSNTAAP